MISRIIKKTVDLSKIQKVDQLEGPLYQLENGGHTFEITCLMDGAAAAVSGTVSARFLRADEETVYFTGTLTGNVASITLPQSCYNVNGRFGLVVFVAGNDITSAIYAVAGNVYRSTSDHIIDPTEEIPSLEDLIAKIGDCEDATEAAEAAAAFVPNMIAVDYANLTFPVAAGTPCTKDGYYYVANTDIATSETWTAAHWTAVKAGNQISDLKSAIVTDLYHHVTDTGDFYWRPNVRVNSQGSTYTTGIEHYTGLYRDSERTALIVYPGSMIAAKPGYTLDYSLAQYGTGTRLQFERGISAGTVVTILYYGVLRVSVTDGTSDTSTEANAKALAEAGLTIDLITKPIKSIVYQNSEDIENLKTQTADLATAFSYDKHMNFVYGQYIVTNVSVGDTVDVANPVTSASMRYCIVPCANGDTFVLTGHSFSNPRLWAFTDGEYKLISKSGSDAYATNLTLTATADGYLIVNVVNTHEYSFVQKMVSTNVAQDVEDLKNATNEKPDNDNITDLVSAQKAISEDWHFGFINVFEGMGLGNAHIIPGTKTLWSESGTTDLTQKGIWMSDGVHPFKGTGVTDMYARTIASQLAMVVPSYRDGVGEISPSVWAGRKMLWMGTSIPAGSDPEAGEGSGSTYPALVASLLGATVSNKSKGSSCVRINASTGEYTGMIFNHFVRALTRTLDECDLIEANWDSIKSKISGAPTTLSASNVATMKSHSFENLIMPYLDGTNDMPDLFVIDHGHNDVRPKGIDDKNDLWIKPTTQMITDGILAEDTYMIDNNYANLKTALGNDLSGIPSASLPEFAASLNRNCFKGAVNFLITLIMRYNPYARVVIVSDYN